MQRLVVIGPLPPPYHGVTVSTSLVLANELLHERFDVRHVDTSDHRGSRNIGRWDLPNLLLGLKAATSLARHLRSEPGLVYLPLSQNLAGFLRDSLFIQIAVLKGWRVAAHLRGGEFRAFYEARPLLLRMWIRTTLNRLVSVAVMGPSLRSMFEGLIPAERIAVVPNGTPEPVVVDGRGDGKTVLFLSNLRTRKGVWEALEAAHLVLRSYPEARFLFVGDSEDENLERELLARAGSGIEIRSAATGAEKDELLARASILLFPPREPEGHPRVVLEGLAAGLPIVTTNFGAIADTVIDGVSGFVLDEPDPKEIADRLLLLLRDEEKCTEMSAAARQRYLSHFTQAQADRHLVAWLENAAAGPAAVQAGLATPDVKKGTSDRQDGGNAHPRPTSRAEQILDEVRRDDHLVRPNVRAWWLSYLRSHRIHFLILLDLLYRHGPFGKAVMDVGAFPGHFSVLLKRLGYDVTAIDLEPDRAGALWAEHSIPAYRCDVETEDLPLPDAGVDAVVLSEVLEHLRLNPFRVLEESYRTLRPGGRLFLSVPHVSPRHRIRFLLGRDYQGDVVREFDALKEVGHMGHYRLLSEREVRAILARVGFSVRDVRVDGWLPGGRWEFVKYFGPFKNRFRSHLYVVADKPSESSETGGAPPEGH